MISEQQGSVLHLIISPGKSYPLNSTTAAQQATVLYARPAINGLPAAVGFTLGPNANAAALQAQPPQEGQLQQAAPAFAPAVPDSAISITRSDGSPTQYELTPELFTGQFGSDA